MNAFVYIVFSFFISFFFDIKSEKLISFYSSVLPFVFALIVGIKAITFKIGKDDYDDEIHIKNDINDMSKEIFNNLVCFFTISLIIFIMMTFSIDQENFFIKKILSNIGMKEKIENIVYISSLVFETFIIMSFVYFVILVVNVKIIIAEILKLNDMKNKR